jgi:hypothetical protein
MLTHVHTSSTLCGYQVGSKGEAVANLEKEKEARVPDRTQVVVLTCASGHLAEGVRGFGHVIGHWNIVATGRAGAASGRG